MSGLASRMKGQRYERELVAQINEKLGTNCRRGYQSRGGSEEADIEGFIPGFHLEAKRQERTNIWAFMRQAEADAKDDEIPVVVTRRNREPSLAVLWFEDLLELIAAMRNMISLDQHNEVLAAQERGAYEEGRRVGYNEGVAEGYNGARREGYGDF